MRLLVSFLRKSPMAGVSSSMPWADCRSCSALSRLRASSTHASGKLAIEPASRFQSPPARVQLQQDGKRRALDIDPPALLSVIARPIGKLYEAESLVGVVPFDYGLDRGTGRRFKPLRTRSG